jgi:hypothetical protein
MSDTNGAGSRKPLAVYAIPPESDDGEKKFWPRIGAAFTNRDGSITLVLDALPLGTNKLQIREPKPAPERPRSADGPPGSSRNGERRFETIQVQEGRP